MRALVFDTSLYIKNYDNSLLELCATYMHDTLHTRKNVYSVGYKLHF